MGPTPIPERPVLWWFGFPYWRAGSYVEGKGQCCFLTNQRAMADTAVRQLKLTQENFYTRRWSWARKTQTPREHLFLKSSEWSVKYWRNMSRQKGYELVMTNPRGKMSARHPLPLSYSPAAPQCGAGQLSLEYHRRWRLEKKFLGVTACFRAPEF